MPTRIVGTEEEGRANLVGKNDGVPAGVLVCNRAH